MNIFAIELHSELPLIGTSWALTVGRVQIRILSRSYSCLHSVPGLEGVLWLFITILKPTVVQKGPPCFSEAAFLSFFNCLLAMLQVDAFGLGIMSPFINKQRL